MGCRRCPWLGPGKDQEERVCREVKGCELEELGDPNKGKVTQCPGVHRSRQVQPGDRRGLENTLAVKMPQGV